MVKGCIFKPQYLVLSCLHSNIPILRSDFWIFSGFHTKTPQTNPPPPPPPFPGVPERSVANACYRRVWTVETSEQVYGVPRVRKRCAGARRPGVWRGVCEGDGGTGGGGRRERCPHPYPHPPQRMCYYHTTKRAGRTDERPRWRTGRGSARGIRGGREPPAEFRRDEEQRERERRQGTEREKRERERERGINCKMMDYSSCCEINGCFGKQTHIVSNVF